MVPSGRRKKASIKVNLIGIPDLVLHDIRSVVNQEQLVCKRKQDCLK